MKKVLNILAIIILVATVGLYFVMTQTSILEDKFNLHLDKTKVVVSTKVIEAGDLITSDSITEVMIDTEFILKNPIDEKDSNFVKANADDVLSVGYVASQKIYPGEQIIATKIKTQVEAENPKQMMYAITVDYLSTVGSSLYAGDTPILWHSWSEKNGQDEVKFTEKVFGVPVEILSLKDGNGEVINVNRNEPAMIPSIAIIRVDENDVIALETALSNQGNKFFFVKPIPENN